VWTASARQQLRAAAAYIAQDRPNAARRWIVGMREAVDRLRQYPFSGRAVPELPNSTKRELIHGAYRVIYEVRSDGVFVLTVRHSRQTPPENESELSPKDTDDAS
jgi:plasmid stabilization system protein ParE